MRIVWTTETMVNMRMKANGNAETMDIVCSISRPLLVQTIRTSASAAWSTPQTSFRLRGGFRSPLELSIPSTNVAELKEVIKKVHSSTRNTTDRMEESG